MLMQVFVCPLEPGERVQENPGESVVCLSEVKRSEFRRGPDFSSERTNPSGRVHGVPFLWSFLLTQAIPGLRPTGAREVRPIRLSCRIVAPKESNKSGIHLLKS